TATSLTGPLGSPRRYRCAAVDLADVSVMRDGLGGSINDAVLAIVSRAFRTLLAARGEEPAPHAVRCLVPVSVRTTADGPEAANRVSAVLIELPVDFTDAGSAYGATSARMRRLKSSHEVDAGEAVVALARYLPPAVALEVLRAAASVPSRTLTTVVTNVPGPRRQARLLGRPLAALYPYVPIADRIRIAVAVTSYGDRLYFGVTCDRDSVGDADVFVAGLCGGVAELVKAATIVRDARP
ncbi:MAG TPA: WS/DGAT domain-containing protein, partial [Jatrophihabitans sp.]|nr:WS/DGAT domain-containing protein [Jatrophihabitans sp.]